MNAQVIVPFHRDLYQLRACIAGIRDSLPGAPIVIAADGAVEDCRSVAAAHGATVVIVPDGPAGPAAARNRAVAQGHGHVLIFVDSDVVPSPDALPGMCRLLTTTPGIAGVFGAYDESPPADNFASQFRNLSHAYTHASAGPDAVTFWAGLGAVRADAFHAVGGFDERFRRPSVEDIDLGHRLTAAGFRLRHDPSFRGTHLKRWTLAGCLLSDVRDRGIPWMQLICRTGVMANDLNTTRALRLAIPVAYGVVAATLLSPARPWAAGVLLGLLVALRWRYHRWFIRQRGWWFGAGVVGMDLLHHLGNGISVVVGTALFLAARLGVQLPGGLPRQPWTAGDAVPRTGAAR